MPLLGLPDVVALRSLLRRDEKVWLVGGAIRDLLLGAEVADLDFALSGDPVPLARALAARVGGHCFFLDESRRQCRVAVRHAAGMRTCDFAPLRAADLEGDLRLRDFTVNALALPVGYEGAGDLFDPLGALGDLQRRLLRYASPGVFEDDPLRVLKGIRHAVRLGFAIEPKTAESIRAAAPLLSRIAPERVRSEVGGIFGSAPISAALHLLRTLDVALPLFEKGDGDWEYGIRLAVRCEHLLDAIRKDGPEAELIDEDLEGGVSRAAVLKLASFGRGFSPEKMMAWGARIKASRRTSAALKALASIDISRADEIGRLPPGRPSALWVAGLGGHPVETLLFFGVLSPEDPQKAAERIRPILRDFHLHAPHGRVPDLLDGQWVRQHLELSPGPEVGKALAALRNEEIAGKVRTLEDGRKFLESLAKKMD